MSQFNLRPPRVKMVMLDLMLAQSLYKQNGQQVSYQYCWEEIRGHLHRWLRSYTNGFADMPEDHLLRVHIEQQEIARFLCK